MNINKLSLVVNNYCKLIKNANYGFNQFSHQKIIVSINKIDAELIDFKSVFDHWEDRIEFEKKSGEENFDSINEQYSEIISMGLTTIFFELKDIFSAFDLDITCDAIDNIKDIFLINKSQDSINFLFPRNNINKILQINIVPSTIKLINVLLAEKDPTNLWYEFIEKMEDFLLELLSFCQQVFPDSSSELESSFKKLLSNFEKEGRKFGELFNSDYPINLEDFDEEDLEY